MSQPARAVGSGDRLGVTLLFSLIAHAVIALGITFSYTRPAPSLPSLDVILVQSASGEKPEKADFLAQANNSGGGTSARPVRPSEQVSSPIPRPENGIAPVPIRAQIPKLQEPTPREMLTQRKSTFSVNTEHPVHERPTPDEAGDKAEKRRREEMAKLAAEVARESEHYAKRPRKKFISANTKEYAYAAYMAAWVARIERIGNLNYPDEARRRGINGQLVLTVALKRNGSVESIDIIQSSGHKILDDAAMRIVRLAAPFPPIPKGQGVDELYITRTWQFLPGGILRNR